MLGVSMIILIKLLILPIIFWVSPLNADEAENTPKIIFGLVNKITPSRIYLDSTNNAIIVSDDNKKWKIFFADCDKSYQCLSMTFYIDVLVNHASLDDVNRLNESLRYTRIIFDDPQKIGIQLDVFLGEVVAKDVIDYLVHRWLLDIDRITGNFRSK